MSLAGPMWNWGSLVWLTAGMGCLVWIWLAGWPDRRRATAMAVGLGLLIAAYVSPLGVLADGYLFSAHMVQHLLLLLIIPLCLVLSLPADFERRFPRSPLTRLTGGWSLAAVGWVLGVGCMWFWHVPTLCSLSTENRLIGIVRDITFVAAGLVFWWPIYSPVRRQRLEPLQGINYLFSACLGCTLLGIYITFTTVSVCPAFANPIDRIGILNRLYDVGLTPGVDQHLAGLLMWVPPCTIYVAAIISLLCRWYTAETPPATSNESATLLRPQS